MVVAPLVLLVLLCSPLAAGFKFLGYAPAMGRSHVNFLGKIADALVDAGHEVTLLVPIVDHTIDPVASKKAKVIFVPQSSETRKIAMDMEKPGGFVNNVWTSQNSIGAMLNANFIGFYSSQCRATLEHPGLMEALKSEKFDVAYLEAMDYCGAGIFKAIGLEKYVVTMSVANMDGYYWLSQAPSFPSYVPGPLGSTGAEMSFGERVVNLFVNKLIGVIFTTFNIGVDDLFKEKYGDDFPYLEDILRNSSLIFLNSEPLIDFPKPTVHRVVDIGGIVVHAGHQPVNKTWSDILSLRKHTILLSFGTVAKSYMMPDSYKHTLRSVFKKFPEVTFIWKYEQPADGISAGIENIVESTWLPQNDILYDPRLTAFITHCGAGSTMESTIAGKPLIVIPVMGDQQRNAQIVKRLGTGIVLQKQDLEEDEKLESAIRTILSDQSYEQNAERVAKMIADRPFNMKDVFVRNMEFVAKFGPLRMLDHYGAQLNFFQFYLIDVFAFLTTILLLVVFVLYKIARFAFSCVFVRNKAKKE